MTVTTRITTACAALALSAAPAVAYAHGSHHHPSKHKSHAAAIGKVATFGAGKLSITLTDGTPVTGRVTRKTVIRCATGAPQTTTAVPSDRGDGRCDSSALTTDTVVRSAKISLTSQGAIWKKVVLLK